MGLIFKQLFEVVNGQKRQTRRLVKPGEQFVDFVEVGKTMKPAAVLTSNLRIKWQVGRDYAVKSSMYSKSVLWQPDNLWYSTSTDDDERGNLCEMHRFICLRVRITSIRQERLQDISEEDAVAEGFACRPLSMTVKPEWVTSTLKGQKFETARAGYEALWNSINTAKKTQWASNPHVWVIDFEAVNDD